MSTDAKAGDLKQLEARISELEQENSALKGGSTHRGFDWRIFGMRAALTVSVPVIVGASLLVWLNRTIFDPNQYIKSVGPVIQQPAVQKAITLTASDKLFSEVDVESKISSALPENAQFLAPSIASQVKIQTTNLIAGVVASQRFYDLWIKANVRAQSAFVKVAKQSKGDPVIDVNDVYQFVGAQMQDTRLAPLLARQLPGSVGSVHVATVPALKTIPHYAALLDSWRWILAGLALVLGLLAIIASRDRRRGIIDVGYSWIIAAAVSVIAVRLVRAGVLSQFNNDVNRAAAIAIWQTVLRYLYIQTAVMFIVGLAAVLAGWYLGYGRRAVSMRSGVMTQLTRAHMNVVGNSEIPVITFMQRQRRSLEWGLLALMVGLLLIMVPLTIASTAMVFVLAIVLFALLEMFAAPTQETT